MSTLLFVHGISIRDERYPEVLPWLKQGVGHIRKDFTVDWLFWGDKHGARLHAGGASIPDHKASTGRDAQLWTDADQLVEQWALLELDPTLELRVLAASVPRPAPVDGSRPTPSATLEERATRLTDDPELSAALADDGLATAFPGALRAVLGSDAARHALRAAAELGDSLRFALARAFVAAAMVRAGDAAGPLSLDGDAVDRLVNRIVDLLGGAQMSWLGVATELGLGRWLERRRAGLSEGVVPWLGDIAVYLTRGEDLRNEIAAAIARAEPPVYLLGHSLGGVACIDLLAGAAPPEVELLITVGSPAPFLYEMDALPGLRYGQHLPERFPRWVNVYDPRDLVAFAGEPAGLFAGHVSDRMVDNRAPFPRSHRAYFRNDRFYELLDEVLP